MMGRSGAQREQPLPTKGTTTRSSTTTTTTTTTHAGQEAHPHLQQPLESLFQGHESTLPDYHSHPSPPPLNQHHHHHPLSTMGDNAVVGEGGDASSSLVVYHHAQGSMTQTRSRAGDAEEAEEGTPCQHLPSLSLITSLSPKSLASRAAQYLAAAPIGSHPHHLHHHSHHPHYVQPNCIDPSGGRPGNTHYRASLDVSAASTSNTTSTSTTTSSTSGQATSMTAYLDALGAARPDATAGSGSAYPHHSLLLQPTEHHGLPGQAPYGMAHATSTHPGSVGYLHAAGDALPPTYLDFPPAHAYTVPGFQYAHPYPPPDPHRYPIHPGVEEGPASLYDLQSFEVLPTGVPSPSGGMSGSATDLLYHPMHPGTIASSRGQEASGSGRKSLRRKAKQHPDVVSMWPGEGECYHAPQSDPSSSLSTTSTLMGSHEISESSTHPATHGQGSGKDAHARKRGKGDAADVPAFASDSTTGTTDPANPATTDATATATTSMAIKPTTTRTYSSKRVEQNRIAQRVFRKRRQEYMKELKAKADYSDSVDEALKKMQVDLDAALTRLQGLEEERTLLLQEREMWWVERDQAIACADSLARQLERVTGEQERLRALALEVVRDCPGKGNKLEEALLLHAAAEGEGHGSGQGSDGQDADPEATSSVDTYAFASL